MTTESLAATAPRTASVSDPAGLLRRAFQVNAASSSLSALVFLVGGASLAERLGSPMSLAPTAVAFLAFAAFVGWLSTREPMPVRAAWTVVALDLLWVAASAIEIGVGMYSPLGKWVVGGMALFVAVLADVQILGILRIRRARA